MCVTQKKVPVSIHTHTLLKILRGIFTFFIQYLFFFCGIDASVHKIKCHVLFSLLALYSHEMCDRCSDINEVCLCIIP